MEEKHSSDTSDYINDISECIIVLCFTAFRYFMCVEVFRNFSYSSTLRYFLLFIASVKIIKLIFFVGLTINLGHKICLCLLRVDGNQPKGL